MNLRFLCSPKGSSVKSAPDGALETKRKGAFFKVFFNFIENQIHFAKLFPRLQGFLTQNKSYAGEKRCSKLCFGTSV